MKTATFIKGGLLNGNANLYKMTPPLSGHDYVVVSAISSAFYTGRAETYIFPANESGQVTGWGELAGSERGTTSHEKVLGNVGYTVG